MKEQNHGNSGNESRRELNQRRLPVGKTVGDLTATAASALLPRQRTFATSSFAEPSVAPEFRSVATGNFSSIVNRDANRAAFGAPFLSSYDSSMSTSASKQQLFDQFKSPIYPYTKETLVEHEEHRRGGKNSRSSTGELNDFEIEEYGWDSKEIRIAPLCPYFPKDLVKAELPRSELCEVQTRLERFFKADSIQAVFINQPASAKLQTTDGVEFRLNFWEARDKANFYVDVQRYRGDHVQFHKMLNRLLDAVKGIRQDTPHEDTSPVNLNKLHEFQSIMEIISPSVDEPAAEAVDPVERVVDYTYASLSSKCFTERTQGLSFFMNATDLLTTVKRVAVPAALVFLRGQAPTVDDASRQEDLNGKATDIQCTLFGVLAKGEYEGDEPLKQILQDKPHEPFLSVTRKRKQCGRYEDCMISSIHKVLSILASSLEAISIGAKSSNALIVKDFLFRYYECTGIDVYCSLLDFMENSSEQMAIGYLACKSMRLLGSMSPALKSRLQGDASALATVEKTCKTGKTCHCLLETESKMLHDVVA